MEDKIVITRVFDSPKNLVWKAWTTPEEIKKWWGPEGFTAPDIKVDLRVGGKYIFSMHGPKGSEFDKDTYSAGIYKEIVPMNKLVITDYFSDNLGNKITPKEAGMNPNFPEEMEATITFEDEGMDKTKLTVEYKKPESEIQFEELKKSGIVEGWNSSLNKLENALK